MRQFDQIIVKTLKRKAPNASITDLTFFYFRIQKKAIFYAFDEQKRNTILYAL